MTSLEITGLLAIILMYAFALVGIIAVVLLVERSDRLMKLGKDGLSDVMEKTKGLAQSSKQTIEELKK